MKTCVVCGVAKQQEEFAPRPGSKTGYRPFCIACRREKAAKHRAENTEKVAGYLAEYNAKHKDRLSVVKIAYRDKTKDEQKARNRAYYLKNKHHLNAQNSAYHEANKEKMNAKCAEWCKENRPKRSAAHARRKATKLMATPAWSDKVLIEAVYTEAVKASATTGVEHHVDHVIPLQSRLVCGLHVHHNLQVLTAFDNIAKRNRYWPDMPGI
jgi:hypothetical protein